MAQVQLHLRIPPLLHERVKALAEEQSVSINQAIVLLIAGGVGFKLDPQRSSRDGDTSGSATAQGGPHEQQPAG